MATLGLIEYADAGPEVRAVYDDIMATRQTDCINNFWKALAHDPATLRRTWESVKQIMAPGALDPLTKEMIYVAVSATNQCGYCIASHTASARKAGNDRRHVRRSDGGGRHGQRNQPPGQRLPGGDRRSFSDGSGCEVNRPLIECVPNFSEGRDAAIVEAIVEAIRSAGVSILHQTMDPDHNRSVVTFAGAPDHVAEGAVRGVARAVELIDLRVHTGVHPRLGAADVVPFVPVRDATIADCVRVAQAVGEHIWQQLGVPVYFYEAAARRPGRVRLEDVRRGQFEGVREEVRTNLERLPDFGEAELHPSAGATVVGARPLLIAFNINLSTPDVEIARRIARAVRTSSGGLPAVKAMGVPLPSRGLAQVSMNLTDFETTPPHVVYAAVAREAARFGVDIAGSEIIGLIPRRAVEQTAETYLRLENFRSGTVLENCLEQLREE